MGGYLILTGIVLAALGLAFHFHRRKREAEISSRRSSAILNDFLATEIMMKNSALNGYKAMLRQPRAQPPASELTWDVKSGD